MSELYDATDPVSIEAYGKKMIGKTFRYMADNPVNREIFTVSDNKASYADSHARKNYKGGMGTLVEECYFGYKANSNAEADFAEAGVELKVTPYIKTKKGFSAKERLVLTKINFCDDVKETDFYHSHVWAKSQLMLLVWYLHQPVKIDSTVDYVQLFTPPKEDLDIIISDYNKIIDKIKAGKAHELSEGDTLYLGACPKAATSKDRTKQPFSDIDAKPRAFSLKNSYMTYIFNNYIRTGKVTYEKILKSPVQDFESYVVEKVNMYRGKSLEELAKIFNLEMGKTKNLTSILAFRILGIRGNDAEEFVKAGIVVKAIRINKRGGITENMSFPIIKYDELAKEDWDNSTFGNYLRNTRFFFVIYREQSNGKLYLERCMFWNIPYEDVEGPVRQVWQKMHDIVAGGKIELHINADGKVTNNFPAAKDNPVSHVRPHARDKFDVGVLPPDTKLNIIADGDVTWPYEDKYTKQCFWLNNKYILKQISV